MHHMRLERWDKSTISTSSQEPLPLVRRRLATRFRRAMVPGAWMLALTACAPELEPVVGMAGMRLQHSVSVGVLEGDSLRTFGLITDVAVGPDGGFAVLDAQAQNVRWFDVDGAFRGEISRVGEGPGELRRPNSIAWTRSGELLVLNSGNHRLSAYAPKPSGLVHLSDWSGPVWGSMARGRQLCEVQGRIYLRGLDVNGMVLHEVDPDEGVVRSFESAVEVPRELAGPMEGLAAPQMNAGSVECIDDPPMVVSMGGYSLVVRSFNPNGELLWETRPEGLVQREWYLGSDGLPAVRMGDDENPTEYGESVVRWGPESVLAQFSTYPVPEEGSGAEPPPLSVELDLRTGVERSRSGNLPPFVAGTADRIWALDREPFPRLTVYDVTPLDGVR